MAIGTGEGYRVDFLDHAAETAVGTHAGFPARGWRVVTTYYAGETGRSASWTIADLDLGYRRGV
jgi:hypothetical protein